MGTRAHDAGVELGVIELDAQHERLIALLGEIEALEDEPDKLRGKLSEFADTLREHFRSKEKLLRTGCPEAGTHAERLDAVTRALLSTLASPSWLASPDRRREHIAYLKAWLYDHLINGDMATAAFLRQSGAAKPRPRQSPWRYRMARAVSGFGVRTRIALLAVLPLTAMLAVAAAFSLARWEDSRRAQEALELMGFTVAASNLVHTLQVERGRTAMALSGGAQDAGNGLSYAEADRLFADALEQARLVDHDDHDLARLFSRIGNDIATIRAAVAEGRTDWRTAYEDYTTRISSLISLNDIMAAHMEGASTHHASALSLLTELGEWGGRERALGSAMLAAPVIASELLATMLALAERQRLNAEANAPPLLRHVGLPAAAAAAALKSDELERMREIIARSGREGRPHGLDARHWFAVTTERLDRLKDLREEVARGAIMAAETVLRDTHSAMRATVSISTVVILAVALALWAIGNSLLVPLRGLATASRHLAEGERLLGIPATDFRDEAGELARAVAFLKCRIIEGELSSAMMRVQGQSRLFDIANSIPGMAYERTLEEDGGSTLTFISDQVERYTGVSAVELIGRPFAVFIKRVVHPDDRDAVRQQDGISRRRDGTGEAEFRLASLSGEPMTVRVLFVDHLQADGATVRRGIAVDVTALKAANQRLQALSRVQAMSQLTGSLAHEINNLIQPILGYGELAKSALPPDHPSRPHLETILTAAGRTRELIANTLAFARGESVERGPVDVGEVIGDVIRLIDPLVPRQVKVESAVESEGCTVLANRTEIAQILVNLAMNACHAMHDRGGRLMLGSSMVEGRMGDEPAETVRLVVEDTGPGIPKDILERLTDLFKTTKEPGRGTGMGLALVQLLVSDMGGTMSVDSTPGKGTRFEIHLRRYRTARSDNRPTPVGA